MHPGTRRLRPNFLRSFGQEIGTCTSCVYNVSCTGTLSGAACNLTLPDGDFTDGELTFPQDELVSEETYTLEVGAAIHSTM